MDAFTGKLKSVDPRARRKPKYESFCAPNGGPVSVVAASKDEEDGTQYEYLKPRFVGRVTLPPGVTTKLRSGQSGYVSLPSNDISLGRGVNRVVANWVEQKTHEAGYQ